MTRLLHSEAGFVRSLQISSKNVFAFVEGRLDRSFYDRLLEYSFKEENIQYEIRAAKELPGGTGGKMSIIAFFRLKRQRRELLSEKFGKKFACIFFADKDIDDLTRKQARSPHLIYTSTYDLEGHLFNCGDLPRALADACGITMQQAAQFIGDQNKWIDSVVKNWKEWIVLCMISQIKSINCGCTFDRNSAINPDLIRTTDVESLQHFKTALQQRLGFSNEQFKRLYSNHERRVEDSIENGEALKYFKGKWLKSLVEKHVATSLRIPDANLNGVGERVAVTLVAQVGGRQNCSCCKPYSKKLSAIVNMMH